MNNKISVIVPVYNTFKYLEECIESVIKQSIGFENIELILINDGSTDFSEKILHDYEKRYSDNIIYLYQKNQGQSVARNKGIDTATSKYIFFLDSDDVLPLLSLETLLNYAEEYQSDVVCGVMESFTSKGSWLHPAQEEFSKNKLINVSLNQFSKAIVNVSPANKLYLKEFLVTNKLTFIEDIHLGEDYYFISSVMFISNKITFVTEVIYRYRGREASDNKSSTQIVNQKVFDDLLHVYDKIDSLQKKYLLVSNNEIYRYRRIHEIKSIMYRLVKFIQEDSNKKNTLFVLEKISNYLQNVNDDILIDSFESKDVLYLLLIKYKKFPLTYEIKKLKSEKSIINFILNNEKEISKIIFIIILKLKLYFKLLEFDKIINIVSASQSPILHKYYNLYMEEDIKFIDNNLKELNSKDKNLITEISFQTILNLYKEKKYKIIYELISVVNIQKLTNSELSNFYFIIGLSSSKNNQQIYALECFAKSLSYNTITPNNALWEYAKIFYLQYKDTDNISPIKYFYENNYEVRNINIDLIYSWFEKKAYVQLLVLFELINFNSIELNEFSKIYFIWGRVARLMDQKKKALNLLSLSLSFNDIAPSPTLWEYASTLYEVYDTEKINRELVLKLFKENSYEVTNIDYTLIENWFEKKHYKQVAVAFELFNEEVLPKDKLSKFYYMWGRTLRDVDQKKKALNLLSLSLSFNDIAPSPTLWEYASTLYEVYDTEKINRELVLKLFKENSYEVTNIDYTLIENWFEKKHYKQVAVAFELFNEEVLPKNKLSKFYYMWGETLFFVKNYEKSIEKFKYTDYKERDILVYNAQSMTQLEKWEESFSLWKEVLEKYPAYNNMKVLNNIIFVLHCSDKHMAELKKYKNKLLKLKLLTDSDNNIDILTIL